MSKKYAIFRTEKIKQFASLSASSNHTRRLKETSNANENLYHLNQYSDDDTDLVKKVKNRIGDRNVRKNAVIAFETIQTFTKGAITDKDKIQEWKEDSIEWLKETFGEENVVDWSLHLDETTPHLHAIVVPIDKNNKLACRNILNGRGKLAKYQTDYAKKVEKYGLKRGVKKSKRHHTSIARYYGKSKKIEKNYKIVKRIQEDNKKEREELNNLQNNLNVRFQDLEKREKTLKKQELEAEEREQKLKKEERDLLFKNKDLHRQFKELETLDDEITEKMQKWLNAVDDFDLEKEKGIRDEILNTYDYKKSKNYAPK